MLNQKKFIVSHAPFWHDGSTITARSYNMLIATLPAVLFGLINYGMPAVGVVSLSISSAIVWELLFNKISKRTITIGDGNAALIGILFGMLLPATSPWWLVITGTFVAVVIGKHIFGGIGGNPFNPVLIGMAILMVSWKDFFDFNEALVNYDLGFAMVYPLSALKHLGTSGIDAFSAADLLMGQQSGAIGATFGLGLIIGGIYLIIRGVIRWEISLSFLAGVFVTALFFNISDPARYAGPAFHLLTGYTLIGAFFLATEDSSSPVNFIPMLIYGAGTGIMAVLIRNIGAYVDGVVFAILLMNLVNPLLDKIRPKALGKVV
ncbi:MAG: RnfABCDGE type electron transport complex subunit D [Deltaproteobacteria bacterium]|nr:RnfABCDGE type electron transport complex subunit D [Deltaproteobacteria bacterium]MBW1957923.1 RnfABCDGE type electron transport complex subunit D [Deltaproteobacteria bacterium]MBW2012653.1 RnfABCDGE type electron transport complex subunit D [Deltaproteobacteria bacterium]MBW2319312.1 RnfABCDGE type electron transport complex subunit D [Deltaproteobacteria bacterium]